MKKYSNILADERPEFKAANYGFDTLSNTELLSMVINRGAGTTESLSQARQLMNIADGSLSNLAKLSMDEMQVVQGDRRLQGVGSTRSHRARQAQSSRAHADKARPRKQSSHLQLHASADGRPQGGAGTRHLYEPKFQTHQERETERGRDNRDFRGYSYPYEGGSLERCNHHGIRAQSPIGQHAAKQGGRYADPADSQG